MAAATPHADAQGRGGSVMFAVRFHSQMGDAELARLALLLDMSTNMAAKMRPNPADPGVARLDRFSGLYLERGEQEDEWVLEGRTWGTPSSAQVRRWYVRAAQAARQLDPGVELAPPADAPAPAGRDTLPLSGAS